MERLALFRGEHPDVVVEASVVVPVSTQRAVANSTSASVPNGPRWKTVAQMQSVMNGPFSVPTRVLRGPGESHGGDLLYWCRPSGDLKLPC